jgi:hypothetical protein
VLLATCARVGAKTKPSTNAPPCLRPDLTAVLV